MNTKILSLHQKGNLAVVQFSAMPNNTLEIVHIRICPEKQFN